ncbi:MAG: HemK family protein methyltransferase [Frankiaceae bacterium]|nr:HemK family protein methyltransferase [Frankiaceae bacterium]
MTPDPGDVPVHDGSPHELSWKDLLAAAREDATFCRARDLVRLCESVIARAGLTGFNSMGSPRKDAEALVFETLAIRDHNERYLDAAVSSLERVQILGLLERRVDGPTPVPYLLGESFFAGRRFTVRPGVFIPRSALGKLLDQVLAEVVWSAQPRALELGCGTGALGISIAVRVPAANVDLVDIDPLAVQVATANIRRHRVGERMQAAVSDMYDGVDRAARYDVIVANLPYVPEAQIGRTNTEIDAEPQTAIYRPGDGLDLVRRALAGSAPHLADRGLLVLEVGTSNQPAVAELLAGRGRWWQSGGAAAGVVSLTRADLEA